MPTNALTTLLLDQRANRTTIDTLPEDLVPQTRDAAYLVQDETVAALGAVGAWKVAPMPAEGVPFAAPILAQNVHGSGGVLAAADLPGLGIEVEVAVTLSKDLPGKAVGTSADDVKAALGSIHLAIEVLASRYTDRSKVPQLAGIADMQSGGAVVLGEALAATDLPEFGKQAMSLSFNGEVVQTSVGNATTENVLTSIAWLAGHAASRGKPLKAGNVIITGARLGPLPFNTGEVVAEAPGLGHVSVRFA